MLQQTQTLRVESKFPQFIHAFPTISTLSNASLADILRVWSGMGYNRRAKYLYEIAQHIMQNHNGNIPNSQGVLSTLPGIGKNTAGAIVAFAFNKPAVFIETNIRSVYIHHFFKNKNNISDKDIIPFVECTLDKENPRIWYFALMDYGNFLKTQENPSRKSSGYRKQSVFRGSNRELRGKIIKLLLTNKNGVTLSNVSDILSIARDKTFTIVETLHREGFIVRKGNKIYLK